MRKLKILKQNEESLQIQVSTYLKMAFHSVIFTCESSGINRSWNQALKAKKQRSQRGLPDLIILEARGGYHGLMIELKREGQTPFKKNGELKAGEHLGEQFNAIQALLYRGYRATFATGFNEARMVIDDYMSHPKPMSRSSTDETIPIKTRPI